MFFKKTKKTIEQLSQEINDLKSFIKNKEFQKMREKSEEYDHVKETLGNIKIKLDKYSVVEGENFDGKILKIKYEIPPITIHFDDNKNPIKNDLFYAINFLELVSYEDMKKIIDIMEKIKKGD